MEIPLFTLQPETKITSNVGFSLMYSVASIQASVWEGCSLVADLAATAMVVLSFNAAAAAISLKRRQDHSPKFS